MENAKKFNGWLPVDIYDLLDKLSFERRSTKTQVVIDGILATASNRHATQIPQGILDALTRIETSQQSTQKALEEIRWMITKLQQ